MDPATYWRLRYLQAESEKAMLAAALAEGRYRAALTAAGVSPEVEHQWHDATTSLVPVEPVGGDGLDSGAPPTGAPAVAARRGEE
jgi:hypothetical protein